MDQDNRVVVLIDMDCFYCQVEEKLNPELKGKPIAVVQYNPWKGGGIIAVNYVARDLGVTRHMRGDEAKEKCPNIQLPSVPCHRGKADISKYRDAGKEVARVLQRFTALLERASIDEAYLDISVPVRERLKTLNIGSVTKETLPNTFVLGYDSIEEFMSDVLTGGADSIDFDFEDAKQLLVGAVIVSEIRAAVYEETGFRCSAGIAHNKILAKLVCGMNKPNKQTILPKHSIDILYSTLPVKKVKHLGGKFGSMVCTTLKIATMGELKKFSVKELQKKFDEKNGAWLYNVARGIDPEPVQARFNPKSIGCCKNFKGKSALVDVDALRRWLKELADEIESRLDKDALENSRTPRQMVASYSAQLPGGGDSAASRSYNFLPDDDLNGDFMSNKAFELVMDGSEGYKPKDVEDNRKLKAPIVFLGISVGKFEDNSETKKSKKIRDYFETGASKDITNKDNKVSSLKSEELCTTAPLGTNHCKAKTLESKGKKTADKSYIINKFFKESNIKTEANIIEEQTAPSAEYKAKCDSVLETSLDRQESFFAKILNDKFKENRNVLNSKSDTVIKPCTPVCDVIERGEDSDQSDYSRSTINDEINKSIALFDEDPQDVQRVARTRELLKSNVEVEIGTAGIDVAGQSVRGEENYSCPECGKAVPVGDLGTHADYHLALNLRDEERQTFRLERDQFEARIPVEDKKKKKPPDDINKTENTIANFFVKINENVPTETCSECGRKVQLDKFSEHLDFHEAQRISRELNKKVTVKIGSGEKRKRKSPVHKSKLPCKSITSFFK